MTTFVPPDFRVSVPQFLHAAGNGLQLVVNRSLAFHVRDERYRPVLDYIDANGLVLFEQETKHVDGLFGRVEWSYYVTPDVRNLLLTNTEETQPA